MEICCVPFSVQRGCFKYHKTHYVCYKCAVHLTKLIIFCRSESNNIRLVTPQSVNMYVNGIFTLHWLHSATQALCLLDIWQAHLYKNYSQGGHWPCQHYISHKPTILQNRIYLKSELHANHNTQLTLNCNNRLNTQFTTHATTFWFYAY